MVSATQGALAFRSAHAQDGASATGVFALVVLGGGGAEGAVNLEGAVQGAEAGEAVDVVLDGFLGQLVGAGRGGQFAAQLFLSPRPVEWHLRKVFRKLGIRSRKELRWALSDPE
jgi:hypothetical protein